MASLRKRRRLSSTSDAASDLATTSPELDSFLRSALAVAMADPSITIGLSLERILDSTPLDSDKEGLVDAAMKLGSSITEVATRSARKFAISHNSYIWPLPNDLTINVFSRLDTQSLCFAAATCSLFRKCALDPMCYANIDLTRSVAKVTDPVVSTMIQRAGKNLQSIKLGCLPQNENTLERPPLTAPRLAALVIDGGAAGLLLRKLHLYNLDMEDYNLCLALSVCKSLSELEIVGINCQYANIVRTICKHCHSIERLCLDIRIHNGNLLGFYEGIVDLIRTCPLLSSLALKGFRFGDDQLSGLIKGARGLKSLDLSGSFRFSGIFLRDLGNGGNANSLETLILRDCMNLNVKEVSRFLSAVCYGDWKSLRYVDISNKTGFVVPHESSEPHTRCAIEVSQVLQERPDIRLIADFPSLRCFKDDWRNLPSPSSNNDPGSPPSDYESSYSSSFVLETSSSSSSDDENSSSSDDEASSSSDETRSSSLSDSVNEASSSDEEDSL